MKRFIANLVFPVILASFFFGCKELLFVKPMPVQGDVVNTFPDFFDGVYQLKESASFIEIQRINDSHCIIQAYQGLHRDSLLLEVNKYNTDSTSAELKGSSLIIKTKDSIEIENFVVDGDFYFTEQEPLYEINILSGYFIEDFDDLEEKKALFKSFNNDYFLNIERDGNWRVIHIIRTDLGFTLNTSSIKDSTFSETSIYYNNITSIKKIEGNDYLAEPTDAEFFQLMKEPKLLEKEEWIRMNPNKAESMTFSLSTLIIGLILTIFLVIISLVIFRRRKK